MIASRLERNVGTLLRGAYRRRVRRVVQGKYLDLLGPVVPRRHTKLIEAAAHELSANLLSDTSPLQRSSCQKTAAAGFRFAPQDVNFPSNCNVLAVVSRCE